MALVLVKCTTQKLKTDNFPSALDSNYYSAELQINNKKYMGVAAVKVPSKEPFVFSVTGYHDGLIRAESEECGYSATQMYKNFSTVQFIMDMRGHDRCLVTIFVYPEFTEKLAGKIYWRGMKGLVAVVKDDRGFQGSANRIKGFSDYLVKLDVKRDATRFFAKGCGDTIDKTFSKGKNIISTKAIDDEKNRVCILEGFLKGPGVNDTVLVLSSHYDLDFVKLSIPKIVSEYRTLKVYAESNVSVMNFKGETVFGNEYVFTHDSMDDGVLRMMTTQGRTMFCEVHGLEEPKCFQ
jgi:hypothetical protein